LINNIKLLPQNNVTSIDHDKGRWQSLNNDPQFAVEGSWWILGALVKISVRIQCSDHGTPTPVVYVDAGHGMSERDCVCLHITPSGDYAAEVQLPLTLKALRFDPISHATIFEISAFKVEVLRQRVTLLQRLWGRFGGWHKRESALAQTVPAIASTCNDYRHWLEKYEIKPERFAEVQDLISQWRHRPLISIVMPTFNTPERWLVKAIESVRSQTYVNWELCISDDCSTDPGVREILTRYASLDSRIKVAYLGANGHICEASNSALGLATGEFVGFLDHDDELHPMALFCVARVIEHEPEVTLIYTDEDKISVDGERADPYFKCDFNYDLFLSQNMICHFGVYRVSVVREIGGFRKGFEGAQDYDMALRFLERVNFGGIVHIPFVLYHWRIHPASTAGGHEAKPYAQIAAIRALQEHLDRRGIEGTVVTAKGASAYNRVVYEVPKPDPSIELIIPTRDAPQLVGICVRSILEKTEYENYSITIVDNGSALAETHALFEELRKESRVRIVRDDSPFNYSAINNRIALRSSADLVGLLNNDMEVISPEWLREMASLSSQPGVGCVGAKLFYPDNTLQHAGIILGIGGVAGHSHKRFAGHASGYFSRAMVRSTMSAVTAACLLIRTSVYREVGGLDEKLSVAFNDVDFCLRVQKAGYRNIWTPYAELFHHESATRGYEDNPEKIKRFESEVHFMLNRWGKTLQEDPYYSPNLTLAHEDFSYASPPRVQMLPLGAQ